MVSAPGRCRALLWGRGAVCAGGQRPVCEPSAPRVVVCCALVFWAPEAGRREIATREPAARRVDSLVGRAPQPPTGTATVLRVVGLPISSARSGTLNSGGTIALPDSTSVWLRGSQSELLTVDRGQRSAWRSQLCYPCDTTGKTVTYAVRSVTIPEAKPAVDPPLIWRCR